MNNVVVGKGKLAGKGVYAGRDFKEGEIVISYMLKPLSDYDYDQLPSSERMFTHRHKGRVYLYSEPERYVNHSDDPNTYQDEERLHDIALRDISKGEMITSDVVIERSRDQNELM